MTKIQAKMLCDSLNQQNKRLSTLQLTMPKWLLGQFAKHRVFSINAGSSRAIPTPKLIKQILNDPVLPIYWGKNQAGMVATAEITGNKQLLLKGLYYANLYQTAGTAYALHKLGLHKQSVNRLLEPYMWEEVIVSATEWDNFFKLRLEKDSQPEMQALAQAMKTAFEQSTPTQQAFHLPYILPEELNDQQGKSEAEHYRHLAYLSSARCARVSYLNHDGTKAEAEKDLKLAQRLFEAGHWTCFGDNTEILTKKGWVRFEDLPEDCEIAAFSTETGQWLGFERPTQIIKQAYKGKMYRFNSKKLDLAITSDHLLLGTIITKPEDKKNTHLDKILPCHQASHNKKTDGERYMKMYAVPTVPQQYSQSRPYLKGCLMGFFLGDGFIRRKHTVGFRLKKERKIKYITDLLKELNVPFKQYEDVYKVCNITFRTVNDYSLCYDSNKKKQMPEQWLDYSHDYLLGLFDGLRHSDGCMRGDTSWELVNTSRPLIDLVLRLAPLIGWKVLEKAPRKKPSERHQERYKLKLSLSNVIWVNDSRVPSSKVSIEDYDGTVYCVSIPSRGIVVRKNDKTLLTHNCFEHQALPRSDIKQSGNFQGGWLQFRQQLQNEE